MVFKIDESTPLGLWLGLDIPAVGCEGLWWMQYQGIDETWDEWLENIHVNLVTETQPGIHIQGAAGKLTIAEWDEEEWGSEVRQVSLVPPSKIREFANED